MQRLWMLAVLLVAATTGYGQVFGGNSPLVHWRYLETDRFRVIHPDDQLSEARRIAALIERINQLNDGSIGSRRRFVNIVLQKETTVSNGYVALAPFRSEFQATAPSDPFDQGSTPWIDQLTTHEYRHIQQYSNFNRGWAKVFSVLLGEQGQAFVNALTIPDWFFEGDAVWQETRLTEQGRGRLASFFNPYRSVWEAGRTFSYAKLRNGSYKDFVPNHYDLGYLLTAYGRTQYGDDFWTGISADAAAAKGLFYPWQKSIRKKTGLRYPVFVQAAISGSRQQMQVKKQSLPITTYADELNPVYTEKGHLLYLSSSFSRIPVFTERDGDKTRTIRVRDRSVENYFSYANGQVVYSAYRPDSRWGWKNYGEIALLNTATGKQKTITRKTKYFTPSLSPKADSIIAVYNEPGKGIALHLLNRKGELLWSVEAENGVQFYHPVFAGRHIITTARNSAGKMAIMAIDLADNTKKTLTEWLPTVIGFPKVVGESLYFTATENGKDRLFRMPLPGGEWEKLDNTLAETQQTGQYQPALYGDRLAWMQFTAMGTRIMESPVRYSRAGVTENTDPLALKNLSGAITTANNDPANTSAGKYRKSTGLLRVHSWLPWYDGSEFSVDLLSQNILNTLQSDLSAGYNQNEGYKRFGFSATYGGWFPLISAGFNYYIDRRDFANGRPVYWNELEVPLGLQLPLNLSRGRYLRYLTVGSNIVFNQAWFSGADRQRYGTPAYQYLDHQVSFSNQVQQARQHINPRFAQTFRAHYRNSISLFDSRQLLLSSSLYFPGFSRNHSIVANLAAQGRDSSNGIRFTNEMNFSRGYYDINYYRAAKVGINYAFPLCYPDVGAFQMVYLLRLRANLFYDHSFAKDLGFFQNNHWYAYRSAGVELMADTKWWNQLPVSFGLRYAYLADPDGGTASSSPHRFEFIVPVNLLPGSINQKAALFRQ